jgi:hypothetical protein
MQAFVCWVRDVIVARTRQVPAYSEWLESKRYGFLLAQEQWDGLVGTAHSVRVGSARRWRVDRGAF